MSTTTVPVPARLGLGDTARVASVGLRTRRLRAALSALGIAIGISAILDLPAAVGTTVAHGVFLNAATATQPVTVLGAAAADRLGITRVFTGERIWVGGQWFYVAGILEPAPLASALDSAVLVGYPAA